LKKIKELNPLNTLVVIDLTGNYEVLCRDLFYSNGFINIHLADGKKINYFKRSKKHSLAKTDKMDSYILSLYGRENLNNLKLYEVNNINTEDLSRGLTSLLLMINQSSPLFFIVKKKSLYI
jgi:hypothetical protein